MCNKWNNLKPEEMPYEKCMALGAESLTDAELLAILLRTGTKNHTVLEVAEKVLSINPEFDGLVGMMHFTPEEYRQVLVLRFMQELSYEEIGQTLKLPAGTVKSRLNRAKAQLKGILSRSGNLFGAASVIHTEQQGKEVQP